MESDRSAATRYPLGFENGFLAPTKYLRFEQVEVPVGRKTSVWRVRSVSSGDDLGTIRWHAPWRQYCFWPKGSTIFNTECLWTITERIGTLNRWQRNIRVNTRSAAA